ncbi:MAG: DinB family protein [Acidobacteriota bacterium]|nr:DinB family protein [Acidobacteriota bacterium]
MRQWVKAAAVLIVAAAAAQAQMGAPPAGPASEVRGSYFRLRPNILKAANKLSAEDYTFKPTPDVRTFARVVNHITEAQLHTCSALLGPGSGDAIQVPAETAGKDAIVAALKATFELCDKAYIGVTDANATEMISLPQGPGPGPSSRSRIGMLWGNVAHDNEQYATLALYLRLKGLVPPTSEK